MTHTQGALQCHDGLTLYCQAWRPDGDAKAALAILHGFGEHGGRYTNIVNALVPRGYAVHVFDLRGHGRSPGLRGHVNHWADLRQDAGAFIRMVALREQRRPLFIFGHSLGGLVALEYALRSPGGLSGVIASSPSLGQIGISPLLFALSKVMSRVWPAFSMDTGLDATLLSRDPAVVNAYRTDPLVHSIGSARLGTEITAAREWVQAHAADMRLPLLLIQGSADRLTEPAGGRAFYEKASSADKEHRLYEGAYHELHNDTCREQMLADLAAWLDRHL